MRRLLARLPFLQRQDVIRSTQLRLTLRYSMLLILFLSLFAAIAYTLVHISITESQKDKLRLMLDEEFRLFNENGSSIRGGSGGRGNSLDTELALGAEQAFYYWIDGRGNLLLGEERQSGLRKQALRSFSTWEHGDNMQVVELQTEDRFRSARGKDGRETTTPYMVASRSLYNGDQLVGTLYVGMDVSSSEELFHWLILVLIGLSLLFFLVALYVSYLMAGRAMIPIAQSLARQREFVADASHELRTPLSILLSSVEALEMEERVVEEPFAKRTLGNMKGEVKGMTRLVGDLLSLARSDSGRVELQQEWFDYRATAERTIGGLKPLLEAKQMRLIVSGPDTLMVRGDEPRLQQLLVILIDNAIKYSPAGEEIHVTLAEGRNRQLPAVVLSVQDHGIGIKPSDHARIFERFYREDKARSRQLGGHGLGLAIAKWIVDTCAGTIQVDSDPGKGSTFTVRIPFQP
ncbi:signal transduction histidine kinase [Paenibacillus phyllosphaerae]|uniref:histidine kinase n=1 Tax=Paenibacillus phyllosphaerae TaxID=274593 RepID=A0A7W5B3V2_9BACL|nr:ATP-binding protein [Paenibacillus phyllosphaerae]MBB3113843.1 signal transduction histidine kinase [Paenibacillus phyllosphaerae]